ncbi:MAG: hypothetical protein IJW98_04645, partial [Clostridia bacterium]|nr:hypothetical protein [Clostridia bacterium]
QTMFIIRGGLIFCNILSFGLALSSPFLFLLKRFIAPPVEPGVYLGDQKRRSAELSAERL